MNAQDEVFFSLEGIFVLAGKLNRGLNTMVSLCERSYNETKFPHLDAPTLLLLMFV